MKRWLGAVAGAAVVLAAGAAAVHGRQMPQLTQHPERRLVGAFHVHSEDSHDSELSYDTLAAAARSLGLDFLIITDHNKQRAAPGALHGVTLISYAELSTAFGHVVGLGAGFLLDKQQRNGPGVLQDLRHIGGWPMVTHPGDAKRPWTGGYEGAAGIEIANMSSAARRYGGPLMLGLAPLAGVWPWERALVLAQLYDRDLGALAIWDARPPEVVGLCGSDTHGWIDPALNMAAWFLVLEQEGLTAAPQTILQAVTRGQFHCTAGLLGRDPVFALEAGPKTLTVTGPTEPEGTTLVLVKDGILWRRGPSPALVVPDPPPGVYRAEVWVDLPRLPWGSRAVPVMYSQRLSVSAP